MSNKRPIAVRGFRLPSFLASEEVPAEGACADVLLEESLLALDVASSSGSFPAPATFAISVLGSSSATDMEQMSDGEQFSTVALGSLSSFLLFSAGAGTAARVAELQSTRAYQPSELTEMLRHLRICNSP